MYIYGLKYYKPKLTWSLRNVLTMHQSEILDNLIFLFKIKDKYYDMHGDDI